MHDGMANFYDALQSNQRFVVDLIFRQEFGVISEVAQKPAELPHGSRGAVQAAGDQAPGQMLGFENRKKDRVIRFLCVPAISHSINPDQKQSVRNGVDS